MPHAQSPLDRSCQQPVRTAWAKLLSVGCGGLKLIDLIDPIVAHWQTVHWLSSAVCSVTLAASSIRRLVDVEKFGQWRS